MRYSVKRYLKEGKKARPGDPSIEAILQSLDYSNNAEKKMITVYKKYNMVIDHHAQMKGNVSKFESAKFRSNISLSHSYSTDNDLDGDIPLQSINDDNTVKVTIKGVGRNDAGQNIVNIPLKDINKGRSGIINYVRKFVDDRAMPVSYTTDFIA